MRKRISLLGIALMVSYLTSSCNSVTSTPLTAEPTRISTNTSAPVPTSTETPLPSPSATVSPTETVHQGNTTVQSRGQFEEWAASGRVKCQGTEADGQSALIRFKDEAVAAGIIAKGQLTLGSGIPSTDNPTQCLFLITFKDGNSVIIFKDGETGELMQIAIIK